MHKKKIIGTVVLFITAFINTSVDAQQPQPPGSHAFSVQQCIDFAHVHNTQVKNALIDYQLQVQTNRNVTSGALPNISASGGITDYTNIPTTLVPAQFFGGTAGTFEPVQFGTKYNGTGSVSLQQTIFDGQVFVGLQARRTSLDYAMKAAEVTEQTIKVNIYKIYYQLAASKLQMNIIDANIARTQLLIHDTKAMHDNGFAEQIDIDKNSVQLANLQTEKLRTQSAIENGYLGLKYLLGMPIRDQLVLTDSVNEDQIKADIADTGYQYTDRKEYQYLQLVKKLNEYNIKRYQLSQLPVLTLNGVYAENAYRSKFNIFGSGDWFTTSYLGLNLNIPIFNGFAKRSNIQTSKLQLQQTQNKLEDLKLAIDTAVLASYRNFTTAIQTLDYQKKNMALAEHVYNQTKIKYEAGVGSTTDILNAETDLKTAQNNYIAAMYDAIIAKIDYNNATGKLK
jgi:outer membrane protein TolC